MGSEQFHTVQVTEVVRAVDAFLFRFACPFCANEQFAGVELKQCPTCDASFSDVVLDLTKADFRILATLVKGNGRKRIPKRVVRYLFDLQAGQCAYCDVNLPPQYHVDHVMPVAAGGDNNATNLALSCPPCNRVASSRVFSDFWRKRDYVQCARKLLPEETELKERPLVKRPTQRVKSVREMRDQIFVLLKKAFSNDQARVNRWLGTPNSNFDNLSPAEAAKRQDGIRHVYEYLFGVVSKT